MLKCLKCSNGVLKLYRENREIDEFSLNDNGSVDYYSTPKDTGNYELIKEYAKCNCCNSRFIFFNDKAYPNIEIIPSILVGEIVEDRLPIGMFYAFEDGEHIGVDNRTSDAWVEEFINIDNCIRWLLEETQ